MVNVNQFEYFQGARKDLTRKRNEIFNEIIQEKKKKKTCATVKSKLVYQNTVICFSTEDFV